MLALTCSTGHAGEIELVEVIGSRLDQTSTATGLPLTLRETPQSISIIDQDFMQSYNLDTVADVMELAPGIVAHQAETGRFFFRARGNEVTNFQFDGLPVNYNSFFSEAVADTIMFERIEIVRGATGLLSGAGEPSAAINLIRKRPTDAPSGYVDLRAGSWDTYRLEADSSHHLDDAGRYSVRVAGSYENGDSYVDLAETDNLQLYGVFTADLSDRTQLTLGGDYSDQDPQGSTWGALPLFYADGTRADDLPRSTTTAAQWSAWNREGENFFATVAHEFDNGWNLRVEGERRKDSMDGYLLYAYGYPDRETGLGMGTSPLNYVSTRRQDAARVYLTGPFQLFGREHRLTSGMLYSEQDITASSHSALAPVPVGNFFEWDGSTAEPGWAHDVPESETIDTQTGAYVAFQLSLHERLTAILGNRFSRYEVDENDGPGFEQNGIDTPYAGLVFDVTDDISLYASYTEIFQPQNARDFQDNRLAPIEGSNAELGAKGAFFAGRLIASVALFQTEKDNVAEPDPDYTQPLPDGSFPQRAVAGAQNEGYELEVTGQPVYNWLLTLSYTHNESERGDGTTFQTYLPDDMVKLSSQYEFAGRLDGLTVGGNLTWQSDVYNRGVGPGGATARQDSYYLTNLMASYRLSDQVTTRFNVKNLFDEKYYSSIDFYNQGFFGAPRSFEASVRFSW